MESGYTLQSRVIPDRTLHHIGAEWVRRKGTGGRLVVKTVVGVYEQTQKTMRDNGGQGRHSLESVAKNSPAYERVVLEACLANEPIASLAGRTRMPESMINRITRQVGSKLERYRVLQMKANQNGMSPRERYEWVALCTALFGSS